MSMSQKQEEASSQALMDPAARVKELSRRGALSAKVDRTASIQHYYRCAPQMKKQAQIYYDEGDLESAFILDNKFLTLFVERIKLHPKFSNASAEDKQVKPLVKSSMERAIELKAKLLKKYTEEKEENMKILQEEAKKRMEEEAQRRAREEAKRIMEEETLRRAGEEALRKAGEEALRRAGEEAKGNGQSIVGEDGANQYGANGMKVTVSKGMEQMAHQVATTEPATTSFTLTDHVPDVRTGELAESSVVQSVATDWASQGAGGYDRVGGMEGLDPCSYATPPMITTQDPSLRATPPPPSYQKSEWSSPVGASDAWASSFVITNSMTSGPIPTSVASSPWPQATAPPYDPHQNVAPYQFPPSIVAGGPHPVSFAPSLSPTWELPLPTGSYTSDVGTRPASAPPTSSVRCPPAGGREEGATRSPDRPTTAVPVFDRSLKPSSSITTSLGGYGGYRPVYVPADTAYQFELAAAGNTQRNAETCGILAGKLSKNELRITHIIIPKQKGSSDSCEMTSEEEVFDVQDKYDVITLGWIHTAFLSSVDLHTQYSYQIMMDEALAIVCAPKYKNVGMFTLTNPYGLDVISRCEQGGFHRHPTDPPLFEECSHVKVDEGTAIEIVDLRC